MSDPSSIPPIPSPAAGPPPVPEHSYQPPIPPPPPADAFVPYTAESGTGLASVWIRLGAAVIDGIIFMIVFRILGKILFPAPNLEAVTAAMMRRDSAAVLEMADPGFFWKLIVSALSTAAFIGINWKFLPQGQTIGKKLLNLQIQSRSGGLLPVNDLILRRILPVYLLGRASVITSLLVVVDALCIFRPGRNTLHDDFAQTKVVQL